MSSGNVRDDSDRGGKGVVAAKPPDVAFVAKAIEAAGLGILALDRSTGGVVYVNTSGAETLQSLSESSQRDALEAITRAVLAEADVADVGSGQPARTMALGGRVVGYSLYPAHDALWAFFRDVTERVRLSTVAEALQLSDALLGVFTALRHDVGNSVNAAKTSLHVLRQGLGRHDEEAVRRYVDRALEALSGVESVLGTLRDYGFASRPRLRAVPIGEVVESAALECGRSLSERGTALDVEVEEGTALVLADPASLEQALCDLVSRAELRARAGPGPRVLLRVNAGRDTVMIRVSPRGGCETAPSRSSDGGDLRLLVVRRLVSQMEGTIDVEDGDAVVTLRRARGAG